MLKHFQVSEEDAVRIQADKLRSTVEQIFSKMGEDEESSKIGADVLLYADLRGVDTHGVSNMLRNYVNLYSEGALKPCANWKVVHETASTATVDADGGLGIIVCKPIMELAIEKARKTGSGSIAIRNSGHAGAVGYFAHMAARADMLGMAMTSGGNAMIPTFGAEPRLGTNPIAFAAPAATEPPFLFDFATTTIARNKIGLARRMGKPPQAGWLSHDDGTPDMVGGQDGVGGHSDFNYVNQSNQLLPLGGTRELGSHKGYSLGVMVDIISGQLSRASGFANLQANRRAHFVQAWDLAGFCNPDEFKTGMDGMLKTLRETKPMPGAERVVYAGLPEAETEMERLRNGIPLHKEVIDWFSSICAELSIDMTLV